MSYDPSAAGGPTFPPPPPPDRFAELATSSVEQVSVVALWAQILLGLLALSMVVGPFVEEDEGESDAISAEAPTATERQTTSTEEDRTTTTERESTTTTRRQTTTTEAPTTTVPPTTATTEDLEVSNARDSAQSYLDLMGFSRTGLIEQPRSTA